MEQPTIICNPGLARDFSPPSLTTSTLLVCCLTLRKPVQYQRDSDPPYRIPPKFFLCQQDHNVSPTAKKVTPQHRLSEIFSLRSSSRTNTLDKRGEIPVVLNNSGSIHGNNNRNCRNTMNILNNLISLKYLDSMRNAKF